MRTEHALPAPEPPLGRIAITAEAVAQIVGQTALECYGVVGMAGRGARVVRLLGRERPTQGVKVVETPHGLAIGLDVVVEYGLNLAEIASALRSRVAYEVERLTGLKAVAVEVKISDARRSA